MGVRGGEPSSYKTVKKYRYFCKKGPFTLVNYCRFLFPCSNRNQDRVRECSKKSAKLMHNRIVIENTRVQLLIRLSKHCA